MKTFVKGLLTTLSMLRELSFSSELGTKCTSWESQNLFMKKGGQKRYD